MRQIKQLAALVFIFGLLLAPVTTFAETDSDTAEKKEASRGYYIGLGPVGLWNLNSSGLGYYFTTGYGFDVKNVIMRLGGEFFGRSGAIAAVGGIGASFFPKILNVEDLEPFIGLDFGYGASRINSSGAVLGEWVSGLVLGPSLGIQLFRTSTVNLELAFKWGFFLASGSQGSPSYSLFRASLYF
ncbi:MAG: hypothetical protein EB078_05015 [Proteobacteria bacterium]|nr:hypothetical protein [Pseudomonadota bacterium]NDD04245.1 hypothetical protein [Pseudomonadota bacterium]